MKKPMLTLLGTLLFVVALNAQINKAGSNYYYDNPASPVNTTFANFPVPANFSSSLGANNTLSNSYTTAIGRYNASQGYCATSIGYGNQALGNYSLAIGRYTKTTGTYSFAIGYGLGGFSYFENNKNYSLAVGFHPGKTGLFVGRFGTDHRIGVGTNNPLDVVHIEAANAQGIAIKPTTNNSNAHLNFLDHNGINNWSITAYNNHSAEGNKLIVNSAKGDALQISGGKILMGEGLDLAGCADCNDYRLFVLDGIRTERVKVDIAANAGWADYVFDDDYQLLSLTEVENYIAEHHHLPHVPSEAEVTKNGIDLAAMNSILLRKIEELTLHLIAMEKEQNALKSTLEQLKK